MWKIVKTSLDARMHIYPGAMPRTDDPGLPPPLTGSDITGRSFEAWVPVGNWVASRPLETWGANNPRMISWSPSTCPSFQHRAHGNVPLFP